MREIKISVQNKIATAEKDRFIVCGNGDYTIKFEFDEEWSGYKFKTALFVFNGKLVPVPFDGDVCKVPILKNTTLCAVGVKSSDEEVATTTPAFIQCKRSTEDLTDEEIPAPSQDVYDEIIALINKYITGGGSSGGGGLTEEQVREIVQETAVTQESDPTVPDWAKQEEKPTYTAQEVGALPSDTQLVEQIDASVDEQTLSITIDLKDKNGEVVSTKTIVLPISNPDLTEYVKFTDIANNKVGAVMVGSYGTHGININSNTGLITIAAANEGNIKERFGNYKPIVPTMLNIAVKEGVTTNTEVLTDDEKASACEWLGAVGKGDIATSSPGSSPTGGELGLTRYKNAFYGGLSVDGNGCVTLYIEKDPKMSRLEHVTNTAVPILYFNDFLIEAFAGDAYPLEMTDEQKAKARALLGVDGLIAKLKEDNNLV